MEFNRDVPRCSCSICHMDSLNAERRTTGYQILHLHVHLLESPTDTRVIHSPVMPYLDNGGPACLGVHCLLDDEPPLLSTLPVVTPRPGADFMSILTFLVRLHRITHFFSMYFH